MLNMKISPKYLMEIIEKIELALWNIKTTGKYTYVNNYMQKWHSGDDIGYWENFHIYQTDDNNIDLKNTLHQIKDAEIILKIAIDLGIETRDYIPSIPVFKNKLKVSYNKALDSFEHALKLIDEDPSGAIGYSNSTLESIIKHILENPNIKTVWKENMTLYKLSCALVKEFTSNDKLSDIGKVGQGLSSTCQSIEDLRSSKTFFHGKTKDAVVIEDKIFAYFILNSTATLGLFLISFYEQKFKLQTEKVSTIDIEQQFPF